MDDAERLRNELSSEILSRVADVDAFIEKCAEAWARAQTALPQIELPLTSVLPLLQKKLDHAEPMVVADELDWEEVLLAAGCAARQQAALDQLDVRLISAVRSALVPMKLDAGTIDDVIQQVRAKLLVSTEGPPPVCEYAGQGSLKSFMRVVAARIALMGMRQTKREKLTDDARIVEQPDAVDPELVAIKAQYESELKAAFARAIASLTQRQRNVLRFQVVDGLSVERVAKLYDVHRVTASRWLADARGAIGDHVREDLRARLGVDTRQFASVVRAVQSQIDLSIERVLVEDPLSPDP